MHTLIVRLVRRMTASSTVLGSSISFDVIVNDFVSSKIFLTVNDSVTWFRVQGSGSTR